MDIGILQGIGTVLAMAAFIAVCIWAWSSKNKQRFDEAAQLPFVDDEVAIDFGVAVDSGVAIDSGAAIDPAPEANKENLKPDQDDQQRNSHE